MTHGAAGRRFARRAPVAFRARDLPRGVLVVMVSGWILWHDIAVHRAPAGTRIGGPTYQAAAYDTEPDCEAGQQAATAREQARRADPTADRLPDGIKVWDPGRRFYTTFRYLCEPAGLRARPFR